MSSSFGGSTFDSSSFDNNTDLVQQKKTSLLDKVFQKRTDLGFSSANLKDRSVEALDADTVRINPSVADKAFDANIKPVDVRLKSNNFGESFNAYETSHGNENDPKVAARLQKQRDTIDNELLHGWFNPATNQDVYDKGEQAKQILSDKLKAVNEGKTGLDFALSGRDEFDRELGDMKFSNEDTSVIDAMNTPKLNSSYDTPFNFAKQNKDTATLGQAVEDTGRLALTGIEGIGSALGYGLEKTGIAPKLGREIQDEHFKHDKMLRSHLSDPVKQASEQPLLDENNNLNPNFGWTSLATNVIPSIPGSLVMGGAGGVLAKALGTGAKAALGAETTASKLLTNGLGFGTSEGVFSAAQNADQWGQEQRQKPIEEFKNSPIWTETLSKNKGNEEATKEDIINQGQSDIFKSTAVTTGALSGLPGMAGGMYGKLFDAATSGAKISAKGAFINALKGMGEEALQEYPQSLFERRTTNQAAKDYINPNQDVSEGQWNDAAIGGLSGFAMGAMGAGGHIASIDRTKTPTVEPTPIPEEKTSTIDSQTPSKVDIEAYSKSVDNITDDNRQEVINQGIKDYPIDGTLPEKIQMASAISKARDTLESPEHDEILKQLNAEIQLQNFAKGMPNFKDVISDPNTSIEDIQDNLVTGTSDSTSINTGSLFNDIGRTKDEDTLNILKDISTAKQKEYAESDKYNDPYVLAKTGIETKNLPKESSEVFSAITRGESLDLNQDLLLLSSHVKDITGTEEQKNTGISALTKTISKVYSDKVDITSTTERTVKQALNTINGLVTNKGTITIEPRDTLEQIHNKILPTFGSQPIENNGNEKANELIKANNELFTALEEVKKDKTTDEVAKDKLDGEGLLPSYREHLMIARLLMAEGASKDVVNNRLQLLSDWVAYDDGRNDLFQELAAHPEDKVRLEEELKNYQKNNPFTDTKHLTHTYGNKEKGTEGSIGLARQMNKEARLMSNALITLEKEFNTHFGITSEVTPTQSGKGLITKAKGITSKVSQQAKSVRYKNLSTLVNKTLDDESLTEEFLKTFQDTRTKPVKAITKEVEEFKAKQVSNIGDELNPPLGTYDDVGFDSEEDFSSSEPTEATSTAVESSTNNEITKPEEDITSEDKPPVIEDLKVSEKEEVKTKVKLTDVAKPHKDAETYSQYITEEYFPFTEIGQFGQIKRLLNQLVKDGFTPKESFNVLQDIATNYEEDFDVDIKYGLKPDTINSLRPYYLMQSFGNLGLQDNTKITSVELGTPLLDKNGKPVIKNGKTVYVGALKDGKGLTIQRRFSDYLTVAKGNIFNKIPNVLNRLFSKPEKYFTNTDEVPKLKEFIKQFKDTLLDEINFERTNDITADPLVLLHQGKSLNDNVVSAFALSLLSFMNSSTGSAFNANKMINSIFGKDVDDRVDAVMQDMFSTVGVGMTYQANSVGAQAVALLGIKSKDILTQRKLEASIGLQIINAGIKAGYLERHFVQQKDMAVYFPSLEEDTVNELTDSIITQDNIDSKLNAGTYFVRITTTQNDEDKYPQVADFIIEILDETKKISKELDELLGTEFTKHQPNTKPYNKETFFKSLGNTWKNTATKYVLSEKEALFRYSNIAYSTDTKVAKHELSQIEDFVRAIGTGKPLTWKTIDVNSKSAEGKNRQVDNDIQEVRDTEELAKKSKGVVYFANWLAKQGREQMTGGPQSNKWMRWYFVPEGMTRTIDKSSDSPLHQYFKIAVLAAFGTKIDALLPNDVNTEFEAIQKNLEPLREAFKNPTKENQQKILEAIWKYKEGYHTYAGMIEMMDYMNTPKNGLFQTNLIREDDGISNGPFIGYLLYNGGKAGDEASERVLNGFAVSSDAQFTYAKHKANGGLDNYELIRDKIQAAINVFLGASSNYTNLPNNLKKAIQARYALYKEATNSEVKETHRRVLQGLVTTDKNGNGRDVLGELGVSLYELGLVLDIIKNNTEFTKEETSNPIPVKPTEAKMKAVIDSITNIIEEVKRNFAKGPTTKNIFGSGAGKNAKSIGDNALANIYNDIESVYNEKIVEHRGVKEDQNTTLKRIQKDILNLTGYDIKDLKIFDKDASEEVLKVFKLPTQVESKIIKQVQLFFIPVLRSAIQEDWKQFNDNRAVINEVMNISNTFVKTIIEKRINNKIKENFDKGETLLFTDEDLKKIYADLEDQLPALEIPNFDGTTQKVSFWKFESTNKNDDKFRVQTNITKGKRTVEVHYKTNGVVTSSSFNINSKSLTGHAVGLIVADIGVRVPIMSIHYSDSMPIKLIMQSAYKTLLVHDGVHGAIDEVDQLSYMANKGIYEHIVKFNPFESTLNYFNKVMELFTGDDTKDLSYKGNSATQQISLALSKIPSISNILNSSTIYTKPRPAREQPREADLPVNKELIIDSFVTYQERLAIWVRRQSIERAEWLDSIQAIGNYGGNETFKPAIAKFIKSSPKEFKALVKEEFKDYFIDDVKGLSLFEEIFTRINDLYNGTILQTQKEFIASIKDKVFKELSEEQFKQHQTNIENKVLGTSKQETKTKPSESNKEEVKSSTTQTNEDNKSIGSDTQYQLPQDRDLEEYVASEKTIRDLAARIADRIGIKVKFESDRTKEYKGKLEGNVAYINLAYATLDTPIHEILGHPIIRTILKNNPNLYKHLLKELETTKGKEVFDRVKKDYKERSLDEQQEEALVELLGLYTAKRLDAVKDGRLISLLKRLLKEINSFVRGLLTQKELEIAQLPDDISLGDIANILAYSNSKLILPNTEVVYTTPDNQTFKTYQEASNHVSKLVSLKHSNIETSPDILFNTDIVEDDLLRERILENYENRKNWTDKEELESYKDLIASGKFYSNTSPGGYVTNFAKTDTKYYTFHHEDDSVIEIDKTEFDRINSGDAEGVAGFYLKNKEYEQSSEIVKRWKVVNNIKYNPEEVYSRGQGFYSVIGAYSDFDVKLMMQNLLTHIEDNNKAGGEFLLSVFTKAVDSRLRHIEGIDGKIRFKIFPKSEDIFWASNKDVYSGSVWDASEKIDNTLKSEVLGVSYTKAPSLHVLDSIQPNLANIIDNIDHAHNELAIALTTTNFRLEYDEDIPNSTKQILNTVNRILDQKYGKLTEPNIKVIRGNKVYTVVEDANPPEFYKEFSTKVEAEQYLKDNLQDFEDHTGSTLIVSEYIKTGIEPKQTEDDIKEEMYSIKRKVLKEQLIVGDSFTKKGKEYRFEQNKDTKELSLVELSRKVSHADPEVVKRLNKQEGIDLGLTPEFVKEQKKAIESKATNQAKYDSQAKINQKVAALKKGYRRYPRSLIRSEVQTLSKSTDTFFQKKNNLGSTPNAKDLLTEKANLIKDVTAENIVSEFDAMPKGTDETHNTFLRNFVSQVIAPVVEATELLLFSKATYTYGQYSAELKKVAINLGQAMSKDLDKFQLSAQEVFAHEFSHAVVFAAWLLPKNNILRNKIEKLFFDVRREFNKALALDSSLDNWNYVFNNEDPIEIDKGINSLGNIETVKHNRGIQEFVAFGTTNKEFRDLIKRLQPKQLKINQVYESSSSSVVREASWLELITNVFKRALDSFMKIANGTKSTEPLTIFDKNVRAILAANNNKPFLDTTSITDKIDSKGSEFLGNMINKGLKVVSKGRGSKVQFIDSLGKYADSLPYIGGFETNKVFRDLTKLISNKTAREFVHDLQKDIVDITKHNKSLTNITIEEKNNDAKRNGAIDTDELGWNTRVALNDKQDTAYKNVIARADAVSIFDAYGMGKLIEFYKDKNALKREITSIKNQIPHLNNKALNLANLMLHGSNWFNGMTEHNAALIAKAGRNIPQDKYQKELDLVTKLSRLYAIGLQDENQVKLMIDLLESNPEGMKANFGTLRELKKQELTERTALTVIDGDTHQTYDPNTTIFLGTEEDAKELAHWNAKVIGNFERDPNDPLTTKGILYLVTVKTVSDWQSQAMAFADINVDSTNWQSGLTKTNRFNESENREKANLPTSEIKTKNTIFTKNKSNVSRVATYNAQGKIINYSYVLNNETKEKYLNPRKNIYRDIAAKKNGIPYRTKTKELNHKLVDALHIYWKKLGYQTRTDMKFIGSEGEYKDLWNMIPTETKAYIEAKFGIDKGFYMVEEEIKEVFGYRKQSITNWIKPVQEEQLRKTTGNMIYDQAKRFRLNQANLKAIETVWIEGIAIAKDTIVVKGIFVSAANDSSNFMTAKLAGVPVGFYIKTKIAAMRAEQAYRRDSHAYMTHLSNAYGNPDYITKEIALEMHNLEASISSNEVSYLHEEGLATTVAEEGSYKDKHQTMLFNKTERARNIFDKLPKLAKDTLKVASMSEGTKVYKLLDEIAQMGDITSRHALIMWEAEKARLAGKDFDQNKAINLAKFLFIQYHTVTNELVQYGNDVGLLMFSKFAVKTLKVLTYMIGHHAARLAALGIFEEVLGATEWIWHTGLNKLSNPFASMMAIWNMNFFVKTFLGNPAYLDQELVSGAGDILSTILPGIA